MLRDDLLHPVVSGNKRRKLIPYLKEAEAKGFQKVITFGGAYSNHIIATAAACKEFGLSSQGIIRGESDPFNPTLVQARDYGMKLYFTDRKSYREITSASADILAAQYPGYYIVPAGGAGQPGLEGCKAITAGKDYDYFTAAAGTGTTAAGMALGCGKGKSILAFPVLKHAGIAEAACELVKNSGYASGSPAPEWIHGYHFGGYARVDQRLVDFIMWFYEVTGVPLDLVYTGKMMYGLLDLIKQGYFAEGSKILAVHTGGLQGNRGMVQRGLVSGLPEGLLPEVKLEGDEE